jgi:membrane associated rhomboid family serine protease
VLIALPYRSKNPPERFPYVTIGLIAINTLVYIATSSDLLVIREPIVEQWAVSHNTLSPVRLLTAMFLHGSLLHLAGNMLFLWIFGAAVEGRLRPAGFLVVYMVSGLAGGLLHDGVQGILNPDLYSLGASGAIMGLAGAYLYMFPYAEICMFWWAFFFWFGVMLWRAWWVVLFYVGTDFIMAILSASDGVGHFAHLGGFGAALLLMFILRPRRDSERVSDVQAERAQVKDYSLLSLEDLETLLDGSADDMKLVMAYCGRASAEYDVGRQERAIALIHEHALRLIDDADPQDLAEAILNVPPSASARLPAVFLLRLASRLERVHCNDFAARVYRRIYDTDPRGAETEAALFRLARLMERAFNNAEYAKLTYAEALRLFPNGEFVTEASASLRRLSGEATLS